MLSTMEILLVLYIKKVIDMKTVVQLDSKDIQGILADYFSVDISKVSLSTKREYRGQGPTEHEVHVAYAEVRIEEKDK